MNEVVDIQYSVRVDRLRGRAEFDEAVSGWKSFSDRSDVECGFWCEPEVVGELTALSEWDNLVLVTVFSGEKTVAVLPFRLLSAPMPLSVGLWRVGRMGADAARLFDYEFAVMKGHRRLDVLLHVVASLRQTGECSADVVVIPNSKLSEGGLAALRVVDRLQGSAIRNSQPTYLVEMKADFERYLGSLSTKTRQTLKRKAEKMQRECGEIRVRCFRAADEMSRLQTSLKDVWGKSWHGRMGRQEPPALPFLRKMARLGWIRSYVLYVDETPVASVLGFQYRGTFLDEAPAFDPRWKRHSPGLVLNYHILQDLFSRDMPDVVDFGFGYNQYKETLGTKREMRGEIWVPVSFRGRRLVFAQRVCDAVFRVGKLTLGRLGVARRLKARMRGIA